VPKISLDFPLEIERHMRKRIRQRTEREFDEVLRIVAAWIDTQPDAPDGDWWKDFGDFMLCGTGAYPKTILDAGMEPFGTELE
jgi:hypothetical protein